MWPNDGTWDGGAPPGAKAGRRSLPRLKGAHAAADGSLFPEAQPRKMPQLSWHFLASRF